MLYTGAQAVFRSLNRGDAWQPISHDLTTNDPARCGRNSGSVPYCTVTTWTSIAANLPASPIDVVVQDRKNARLLIVGNDLGVWVSADAGARWSRLAANLPTVPVHDLTIHPRENDLGLGTYGRGIFIGDVTVLQELTPEVLSKPAHLFAVEPRAAYGFRAQGNYHLFGDKYLEVPNEPEALVVSYYLRDQVDGGAQITTFDIRGEAIATLTGPGEPGLNRALWNMRAGSAGGGQAGRRVPDRAVGRGTAGHDNRTDPRADRVNYFRAISSSTIQPAPCTSRAIVSAKRMSVLRARPAASL